MSIFYRKSKEICLSELDAVSEYCQNTFQAPMNLEKLQHQIDSLVEEKISSYSHNRFKDWTVPDLILLSKTIDEKILQEKPILANVERRGRKKKLE